MGLARWASRLRDLGEGGAIAVPDGHQVPLG